MTAQTPGFTLRDEGELNLYLLHNLLCVNHVEINPDLLDARREIVETLRYLNEKEPVRAALVRRCLSMAAALVSEAAALVNEGMHWPTVEALLCPPEEAFAAPVIGHAGTDQSNGAGTPAEPLEAPPPAAPSKAALRRHGRSLRDECEQEKRRFYAIAQKHGLPTGLEAGDAIRAALADLFNIPITSGGS